ncbi:PREDICTED: vinculin-like isoform X4 [Crocodylus porosus]|uniref:vinculin-like isoform X4 n=1 Tax=Crocodylus porosus TaxID=8502 RepID=UPI000939538D|nr:PREDICTED: vinculin-like isoform X4 [Crocodylus porosus]
MEPLYLYDISTLINSKTTERIISPMTAQLCHLIIAMEWEGVDNETFPDLGKTAEELAKSTEELAFAARRLAEESNDEVLRGKMCPAAESVLVSGKSTLLAAQKLNIQPEIQSHKEELIVSAQRVLMETMRTKEQLVDCAGQVASKGQVFVKFGHIIAKNCLDDRCAPAVLHVTEQIQTISSQLSILARVKAAIAGSRCSAELLVNNAQNLIQAVLQLLKAAEAACIKGLRQPSPDSEEWEVAAFCTQWRKNLLWHRTKEALNPDRDELGLRKTRAELEPTLTALVQGPSSQC